MNAIDQNDFDRLWEFVKGMARNHSWFEGSCFVSTVGNEVAILGKGCFSGEADSPDSRLKKSLYRAGFLQLYPPLTHGRGWLLTLCIPGGVEPDSEMLAVVRAILRLNGFKLVTEHEARP